MNYYKHNLITGKQLDELLTNLQTAHGPAYHEALDEAPITIWIPGAWTDADGATIPPAVIIHRSLDCWSYNPCEHGEDIALIRTFAPRLLGAETRRVSA